MTPGEPVSLAERRTRSFGRRSTAPAQADVLARLASALTTQDRAGALREVAATALDLTAATSATVLLAAGGALRPVATVGDGTLASLPAVGLAEAGGVLAAPGAVPGSAAAVPLAWRDALVRAGAVVVPLRAGREVHGVLVAAFAEPSPEHPARLDLLETLATYAAVAARGAALDERAARARAVDALVAAVRTLAAATDAEAVARSVAEACRALPGVTSCAVGLREAARTTAVEAGVAGSREPAEPLRSAMQRSWSGARRPVVVGRGDHLAIPFAGDGDVRGVVLLGLQPDGIPAPGDVAAAEAVAALGAAALERADVRRRLRREARRVEVLHRLGATVDGAGGDALVRRLNDLLADTGDAVLDVRQGKARAAAGDDVFPLRAGRRVVGELVAVPSPRDQDEVAFLRAVAAYVGEATARASARAEVAEAARERTSAAERDRIAADLHDGAGELFVGIAMLARRAADELPADSPWAARFARLADLGRQGKWSVDDGVRALGCVPARQRGLVESLRALGRSVAADSGVDVVVRVEGRHRRLPVLVEHALFRVASLAVANAWRLARCVSVDVVVSYDSDGVRLRIRDDGVGLAQRDTEAASGAGATAMRRAMVAVGGTLRIANAAPHGVVVEARALGGTA